jgi:RNA polymerase sigma-70 factor (ECF subfamily)
MTSSNVADRDAQWIARLRDDDEGALRDVMDAHFDDIAALAFRYVHSRDLARDIAQETFIRFWDQRHHLTADTAVRPYLARVARNRALDILRQDTHAADLEQRIASGYVGAGSYSNNEGMTQVEADEFHMLVRAIADTLTPRVREVLLLYFEEQLEPAEIASVLGVAPKTVYNQLHTALQVYAKALVGRWP